MTHSIDIAAALSQLHWTQCKLWGLPSSGYSPRCLYGDHRALEHCNGHFTGEDDEGLSTHTGTACPLSPNHIPKPARHAVQRMSWALRDIGGTL